MADALAAVTWHLNEYVRSILSGFRSPFEIAPLALGRAEHPCSAAANQGWLALPNHLPPEACIHICTFAQAAGRFAPLHLGQHVVLSLPRTAHCPNRQPLSATTFRQPPLASHHPRPKLIPMRTLLLLLLTATLSAAGLKVGDPAPATRPESMLQGEAVKEFKKGEIYVFECWASWCGPCIAAIPPSRRPAQEDGQEGRGHHGRQRLGSRT